MNLKSKIKSRNPEKKEKKKDILKNLHAFFDSYEGVLDAFESKIFQIKIEDTGFSDLATRDKVSDPSKLKILSPKQVLQRLPITLAQVNAGNTSEKLLN